jgi:hypothetical protein
MSQATELIAQQYANAAVNKKVWSDILYIVKAYGALGNGSDETSAIQATITDAIANNTKSVFFPHGTYVATALTGLDSVVLLGDNATLTVGGSAIPITQLGAAPQSNLSRQVIINGNFDVWQRGTSFTTSGYSADRWYTDLSLSTLTRQSSGVPIGSKYCSRVTMTGAGYGNYLQALESDLCSKLTGNKVTLSLKIRRNSTFMSDISIIIQKNATADTLLGGTWTDISNTKVTNANIPTGTTSSDWYLISVTVIIPTDGTANGIRVSLQMNTTSTSGAYYEIAQAQISISDTTLPFQSRSFADELALCQRYYEKSYSQQVAPGTATVIGVSGMVAGLDTATITGSKFSVKKRIAPTVIMYSQNGTVNKVTAAGGADTATATATIIGDGGFATISSSGIITTTYYYYHFTADAEL